MRKLKEVPLFIIYNQYSRTHYTYSCTPTAPIYPHTAVNAGFSLELVSSPRMSPYASTSDNYFPRTSSATVQEDTKRHSEHEGGGPARVQSSGEQPNDNGANANALGLHVPTIEGIDHLFTRPPHYSKRSGCLVAKRVGQVFKRAERPERLPHSA